ncbi:MAG: NusG domain II-containing protein [Ruminococcaceae bacterium]|nr:NusG domain II-containing protein [Oscillospiraceae bacterium]
MKKADKKLIIVLAAVGVIALAAVLLCSQKGTRVVITQDKKQLFSGSLYYNQTIELGTNVVEIKNGSVDVVSATCKNKVCVNHKKITKKGEQIVCLPNKIIITVK